MGDLGKMEAAGDVTLKEKSSDIQPKSYTPRFVRRGAKAHYDRDPASVTDGSSALAVDTHSPEAPEYPRPQLAIEVEAFDVVGEAISAEMSANTVDLPREHSIRRVI